LIHVLPVLRIARRLCRDDRRATAVEYGLISSLASITIFAMLGAIGDNLVVTLGSAVSHLLFG
jgi:Flp pilus assembly pilin Flp